MKWCLKWLSCPRRFSECGLTHEQLIDVGILIGTDFNPDGVKGIGPKTALKLIKQYGSLKSAVPHIENVTFADKIDGNTEIFLTPQSHRQLHDRMERHQTNRA